MEYSELPKICQWENRQIYREGTVYQGRGGSWIKSKWREFRSEVFPGICSSSEDFALAKLDVIEEASKMFPEECEELQMLKTDMDQPSSLGPLAPRDNRVLRKEYNCREPDARAKKIAQELIRLIIRESELTSIAHRDVSSSGAPDFIKGSTFKKSEFHRLYKDPNVFNTLVKTCAERDLAGFKELEIYPFYTKGERKHFVKPGKIRNYITPETYPGEAVFEEVDFTHPYDNRLHCYDRRFMYAAPTGPNMACQILNNALMTGFKKLAYFARYNGELELSKEIKELGGTRKLFSLDKRKFGETFCNDISRIVYEELKNSIYFKFAQIAESMCGWPIVYTNVRRGSNSIILSNSPDMLLEEFAYQAFCSGHGMVAFKGQFNGSLDALLMMEHTLGIELDVEKACKGYYSDIMWFKNKGDDTIFSLREEVYPKFSVTASLHADEIEDKTVFLGYDYLEDGSPHVTVSKYLCNTLLPERDFKNKSFPKLGHILRLELYQRYGDRIEEAFDIMNKALLKRCRFDFKKWLDTRDVETEVGSRMVKSEADAIFLNNPDVINYKMDPTEVSPELLRHFYHYTEPDEFIHLLEV